jgi:hypothetical protein
LGNDETFWLAEPSYVSRDDNISLASVGKSGFSRKHEKI